MITNTIAITLLFLTPLCGSLLYISKFSDHVLLRLVPLFTGLQLIFSINLLIAVLRYGEQFAFGKIFFADTLSGFELCLVSFIFFGASLYMKGYFEGDNGHSTYKIRQLIGLWNLFLFTMTLVFLSNNMGILWVAIEATTLASAFLILTKGEPASIEAMWKYLLVCSVGIAFGLVGTLLLSAASKQALAGGVEPSLLWTELRLTAASLDKGVMLAAFIFALVGFGTKAGLAPMHTWLPDAHSQAPSPVSAVFSAVMLNCALYSIFRFLPLVEGALGGTGQARILLIFFGLLSIGTAMVFIPLQRDIKRFLAYSSIEHIGIIVVGVGLGGIGVTAALLHTFNHSIAKMLAFFSSGKIVQTYGTREMDKIHGAVVNNRTWGLGFLISTLVLIGAAPFSIFTSELQILKAGFDQGKYVTFSLLIIGVVIIFIGALRHIMKVSFGAAHPEHHRKSSFTEKGIVISALSISLFLGVWIPSWFWGILEKAANIIGK